MNAALATAAVLLGVAGSPHCAAMCGAACAGVMRASGGGWRATLGWHGGRLAGYMAAGAVLGTGVAALGAWSTQAGALRPLWMAMQAAALLLGAWLLFAGRQPAWIARIGSTVPAAGGLRPVQWLPRGSLAATSGLAWVALPCGLLQSALLIAALGAGALDGALLMGLFGLGSAIGLAAGPALWSRITRAAPGLRDTLVRLAGLLIVAAAAWALASLAFGPRLAAWLCL